MHDSKAQARNDWEAVAAAALAAAGVPRDRATEALVGRALARIGRTFAATAGGPDSTTNREGVPAVAPLVDARTAAAARAGFVAALRRLARD